MAFEDVSGGGRSREVKTIAEGRYRVIRLAGRGGMSVVYHAYDTVNDRDVAIKVLSLDLATEESFLARFQRESELMRDLNHPHILRAYDYGQDNEVVYLVMSYYGGGTLKERMNKGPLPLAKVVDFLSQVASGLGYAHSRGIIHRDIKPSNILVHHASENLVLSDFGIAKALSSVNLMRTGTIMGTPLYMAPEQFLASGDQRADIYALGVVLFQLLTGDVPFKGEGIGFKHMNEPVPSLRNYGLDYDEQIEAVVRKALAKQPENRYQKAEELAEAFSDAVRDYTQSPTQIAFLNNPPTPEEENDPSYTPWATGENTVQRGILPGQDSLSAIPVGVPPTPSPLAGINSGPLPPQATSVASPVNTVASVPPSTPPPATRPYIPPPTQPYNPLPQSYRAEAQVQTPQNRAFPPTPAPDPPPLTPVPVGRSQDVTQRRVELTEQKKGGKLGPILGLLAGFIVVMALGGAALFFLFNFTGNNSNPTTTSSANLPGTATTAAGGTKTASGGTTVAGGATTAPRTTGQSPSTQSGAQTTQVVGSTPRQLQLVFTSRHDSNKEDIFFYDPQLGTLKALTDSGRASLPSWSPDGRIITYQYRREDNSNAFDIYRMSAEGVGQQKIVEKAHNPAFAHQGSKIVYVAEADNELYTTLVDGSKSAPVKLTSTGKAKYGPVFSPDDTKIAFAQDDEQGGRQIYVMENKPGANPVKITKCSNANCIWPSWSPDGTQIVYNTNDPKNDLPGEIWVVNADGTNERVLVNQGNGGGRNSHPIWVADNRSASGSRIYFNSDRGAGDFARVYVMDPDGSRQQLYIKHPGTGPDDAQADDYAVSIHFLGS